jgi:hypothetical protein
MFVQFASFVCALFGGGMGQTIGVGTGGVLTGGCGVRVGNGHHASSSPLSGGGGIRMLYSGKRSTERQGTYRLTMRI